MAGEPESAACCFPGPLGEGAGVPGLRAVRGARGSIVCSGWPSRSHCQQGPAPLPLAPSTVWHKQS